MSAGRTLDYAEPAHRASPILMWPLSDGGTWKIALCRFGMLSGRLSRRPRGYRFPIGEVLMSALAPSAVYSAELYGLLARIREARTLGMQSPVYLEEAGRSGLVLLFGRTWPHRGVYMNKRWTGAHPPFEGVQIRAINVGPSRLAREAFGRRSRPIATAVEISQAFSGPVSNRHDRSPSRRV